MDIGEEIKKLLENCSILPDAQASSFRKFLSMQDFTNGREEDAIVNIINSLATQLRNDVNYLEADSSRNKDCPPVLKSEHLDLIQNIGELKSKLRELPNEWTVVQLIREFDPADVTAMSRDDRKSDPTLVITRLHCGQNVDKIAPYIVRVLPPENSVLEMNLSDKLSEILLARKQYYNNQRDRNLKKAFDNSDAEIATCLNELETYWLREWKCLLHGRLRDFHLENEIRSKCAAALPEAKNSPSKQDDCSIDMVYLLTLHCHHLKARELLSAVKLVLTAAADTDQVPILMDKIKSLNQRYLNALNKTPRHPVIIITEQSLELFPWEMTVGLASQPACRVLSFHLLYALYKYHAPHIKDGYRELPVTSGYCLLNPDKSLPTCEKELGEFLKNQMPWFSVEKGKVPEGDQLAFQLSNHTTFLYCGHGSASQYYKFGALKKTLIDCVVLLYGCSSTLPRGRGGRTPYQNETYTYLTNGCPCLIGALYDITSSDADRACCATLAAMLPTVETKSDEMKVISPAEPDVLQALLKGKQVCHKFWTKCCFTARGLPTKIICNSSEKSVLLGKINS